MITPLLILPFDMLHQKKNGIRASIGLPNVAYFSAEGLPTKGQLIVK